MKYPYRKTEGVIKIERPFVRVWERSRDSTDIKQEIVRKFLLLNVVYCFFSVATFKHIKMRNSWVYNICIRILFAWIFSDSYMWYSFVNHNVYAKILYFGKNTYIHIQNILYVHVWVYTLSETHGRMSCLSVRRHTIPQKTHTYTLPQMHTYTM